MLTVFLTIVSTHLNTLKWPINIKSSENDDRFSQYFIQMVEVWKLNREKYSYIKIQQLAIIDFQDFTSARQAY